jgi:hypothetical protein
MHPDYEDRKSAPVDRIDQQDALPTKKTARKIAYSSR